MSNPQTTSKKSSQSHYLPSILFVVMLLVLFVWSIADAIHQSALNAQSPDDCSNCGIGVNYE